jgi:hypothetical protein
MEEKVKNIAEYREKAISQPLIEHIYTADPSAHVFNGKLYLYPSHDIDAGIPFNDNGDHFGMEDYHVIRIDDIDGKAVDCGIALHIRDVPWAERQMWAPDAAYKDGKYYFFFPAKKHDGIFQIGVAIGDSPEGPFVPEAAAIEGSYSIDPAVFADDDGVYYMYFGGIWGGQLQKYRNNVYGENHELPEKNEPSLCPKVARMTDDLLGFSEPPRDVLILDVQGNRLTEGDNDRRFFEASWMHKYNGQYYFSYSTGDTHYLCYAIGDNPYGPFTYGGCIMNPVLGWTTHHSICEFNEKWYVFYHDSTLSEGITHLRSIKMSEIEYDEAGHIRTLNPYIGDVLPQ